MNLRPLIGFRRSQQTASSPQPSPPEERVGERRPQLLVLA
jgi:hypothetical protein